MLTFANYFSPEHKVQLTVVLQVIGHKPNTENAFSYSEADNWNDTEWQMASWQTSPSLIKNSISMNKIYFKFTTDFSLIKMGPTSSDSEATYPEAMGHCSLSAAAPSSLTAIKWRLWKAYYGPPLKEKKKKPHLSQGLSLRQKRG